LLNIVEVGLAASDAAGAGFAEEVLHALGDEEGDDKGQSKAGPALFPLPELARDHSLARETASSARTRDQGDDNNKDDDRRNDQSDDGKQADRDLFLNFGVGDAQVH
jgi:hypothetical protein